MSEGEPRISTENAQKFNASFSRRIAGIIGIAGALALAIIGCDAKNSSDPNDNTPKKGVCDDPGIAKKIEEKTEKCKAKCPTKECNCKYTKKENGLGCSIEREKTD